MIRVIRCLNGGTMFRNVGSMNYTKFAWSFACFSSFCDMNAKKHTLSNHSGYFFFFSTKNFEKKKKIINRINKILLVTFPFK